MNDNIPAVGNIMVPLDKCPQKLVTDSIASAIELLMRHLSPDGQYLHFEEVLVFSKSKELLGTISINEILISLFPTLLASTDKEIFLGKKEQFTDLSRLLEGNFQNKCLRQSTMTISEHMVPPPPQIDAGMHPLHALEIMMKSGGHSLPVKAEGQLAGIVRKSDIFKLLGSYCTL